MKRRSGEEARLTWIAVHTRPAQEWLAEAHLRRQGYRVFAPWFVVEAIRNARLRIERRPWFARYIFVGLDESVAVAPINSTIGVSTVVYVGDEPIVVPWPVMRELIDAAGFDGLMPIEQETEVGPRRGEIRPVVAGPFLDRLAEIAADADAGGRVSALIGYLRVSMPASWLAGGD